MAEDEKEFELAKLMKKKFCDERGREQNVEETAKIIHQIGLIYRKKSPDKISLIQSAGLFNAAIYRNPSNVSQIKSDLKELCQHILQMSDAKNQQVDLIKRGRNVAKALNKLRTKVKKFLTKSVPQIPQNATRKTVSKLNTQKIVAIRQINKTITGKYKTIMAELGEYCEKVMGKSPCQYAIAGMGSLAREEATPYSDFEHIILLKDDRNYIDLEYFRWFSVIFHIVVLNVQETIVPSLNIDCFNNQEGMLGNWFCDTITPRGISFDGMMPHACKFPLGRQQFTRIKLHQTELIKPVSEMLQYLSWEENLKNGYHLADMLKITCFVHGDQTVYKQFEGGVKKYLNMQSKTDIINNIQLVKYDLHTFSIRFGLARLTNFYVINVSRLIYRSITLFISALAKTYKISSNSCFEMIEQMAAKNKITFTIAEKLKCGVAIACEIRLKVFMKKQSNYNVINLEQEGNDLFCNIVGLASTINFFQIAYCLQCEVAKQFNLTEPCFYSDYRLINLRIGLTFKLINVAFCLIEDRQKRSWVMSGFNFDECIEELELNFNVCSETIENFGKILFTKVG